MSRIQMGQASIRLIKFLAENGPRTNDALLAKFPGQTQRDMSQRLRHLATGWWIERYVPEGGEPMWRVHPSAYPKFPGLGLQVPPPVSAKRGVGRPRDVYVAPEIVQPRRISVFDAPTLTSSMSAPARAGAMDFLSYPSRGF